MTYKQPRGRFDENFEDDPGAIYGQGPELNSTQPVGPPVPMAGGPTPNLDPPAAPAPPTPAVSGWSTGAALPGWNQEKWDNPNKNNQKYTTGRILAKYADEQGNLSDEGRRKSAIDELLAAFQGSSFDGKDALYIPELGSKGIDIFGDSSKGIYRPQFLDLNVEESGPQRQGDNPLAGLMGMPGGSSIFSALTAGSGLGGSDLMSQIQAELQKLLSGR